MDYNEIFSPVVKHTSICALLAMFALFDLELDQLDVNTTFLMVIWRRISICASHRTLWSKARKIIYISRKRVEAIVEALAQVI